MPIRSHVDPTLFVIFLHIDEQEYGEEFRALVRSLRPTKGTNVQSLFAALNDRQRRTMAHERYHFWQGLRLPFLHTYATITLRSAFLGVREMARTASDWRNWMDLGAIVNGFDRLDSSFDIAGDPSGKLVFGQQRFSAYDLALEFSAKEMLECAASIFDYHGACETRAEISDPVQFKRWRKRHPAYLRIYDFLAGFLELDRLSLRVLLPLINASFQTSFPERAFAELTARMWRTFVQPGHEAEKFLAQNEPCRWPEMFGGWLTELEYDCPYGSTPDEINFDDGKFYYMDPKQWLGGTLGGGLQHPFLGPLAQEWQKRAQSTPGLEFYLDFPGYASNPQAHEFAFAAEPQLRVIRVFVDDGPDKVFSVGDGLVKPAFLHGFFAQFSDSEFRGFVLDMLAAYGAFRRATGAHMTDVARTCHHTDCPHFEANYCNSYPLIPERFEDCGFPNRLRLWIEGNRR